MTTTRSIQHGCCWWWFLVLVQSVSSSSTQAQFKSFCNQTLNISSLSMIFTPSPPNSSCCNITFVKSDLSEQITINILKMSTMNSMLKILNQQMETIPFYNYPSSNRSYLKSDIVQLPITFSLCQLDIPSFEILITNISKGPCKSNQYRCLTPKQDLWCIDETYHCDGYHSCPQGMDENGCTQTASRLSSMKSTRTIRGGIVTTIIVLGLLLIIASVSIALAFVYIRRKNQRRRHFTYSLESTSDDWEASGTRYQLFDNWTDNRRTTGNQIDNVIIDANEHMPIAASLANR